MAAVPIILVEQGVRSDATGPAVGESAGPAASIPDPALTDVARLAADHQAPVLAAVEPLPEVSPARPLTLSVIAGDLDSGVVAWILYVTEGAEPPRDPEAWRPVGGVRPWTAPPNAGQEATVFPVVPGRRYHFAAQAADRAGNWTALPPYSQASTRIARADQPTAGAVSPTREIGRPSAQVVRAARRPTVIAE